MTTFKGNNELHINHATMMLAVQMWLDATMTNPPKVTSVSASTQYGADQFILKIEEKPDDPQ
jgi:hypothetical protein